MENTAKQEIEQEIEQQIEQQKMRKESILCYNLKIDTLVEEIKEADKKIYKLCQHIWIYDTNCSAYDKTRYICETCSLYKNGYLYK